MTLVMKIQEIGMMCQEGSGLRTELFSAKMLKRGKKGLSLGKDDDSMPAAAWSSRFAALRHNR
jgi:hypothetical protein